MRPHFIAGAKLLGILMLYWAVSGAILILTLSEPFTGFPGADASHYFLPAVSLVFGLLLTFATARIADLTGMQSNETVPVTAQSKELLQVGLILVGIFYAISHLAEFMARVARLDEPGAEWSLQDSLVVLGQLLPFCLVFGSAQVACWLWPTSPPEKPI